MEKILKEKNMRTKENAPVQTTPNLKYDPVKLKKLIVDTGLSGDLSYEDATTLVKSCKLQEI